MILFDHKLSLIQLQTVIWMFEAWWEDKLGHDLVLSHYISLNILTYFYLWYIYFDFGTIKQLIRVGNAFLVAV